MEPKQTSQNTPSLKELLRPSEEPPLCTDDAARFLGIAPCTLREYAADGRIPSFRVGPRLKFRPADLRAFLASCANDPVKAAADRVAELAARMSLLRKRKGELQASIPGFDVAQRDAAEREKRAAVDRALKGGV